MRERLAWIREAFSKNTKKAGHWIAQAWAIIALIGVALFFAILGFLLLFLGYAKGTKKVDTLSETSEITVLITGLIGVVFAVLFSNHLGLDPQRLRKLYLGGLLVACGSVLLFWLGVLVPSILGSLGQQQQQQDLPTSWLWGILALAAVLIVVALILHRKSSSLAKACYAGGLAFLLSVATIRFSDVALFVAFIGPYVLGASYIVNFIGDLLLEEVLPPQEIREGEAKGSIEEEDHEDR